MTMKSLPHSLFVQTSLIAASADEVLIEKMGKELGEASELRCRFHDAIGIPHTVNRRTAADYTCQIFEVLS